MDNFFESTLIKNLTEKGTLPEVPVSLTRQSLIELSITIIITVIIIMLVIAVINKIKS